MKTNYAIFRDWAKDKAEWFLDMDSCFKFEMKKKSYYVYSYYAGESMKIETFKKGGPLLEICDNIPAVSWAIDYIKKEERL